MLHTDDLYSRSRRLRWRCLSFHRWWSLPKRVRAIAILVLTSLSWLPPASMIAPRYLKCHLLCATSTLPSSYLHVMYSFLHAFTNTCHALLHTFHAHAFIHVMRSYFHCIHTCHTFILTCHAFILTCIQSYMHSLTHICHTFILSMHMHSYMSCVHNFHAFIFTCIHASHVLIHVISSYMPWASS